MPVQGDFQRELGRIFREATSVGSSHIDVVALDLHRRADDGTTHRMPNCCALMRKNVKPGIDRILGPDKDTSTFTVRYQVPR